MIDDSDFIFAQSLREKKCFCWCHTNTLGTILRRFPLVILVATKIAGLALTTRIEEILGGFILTRLLQFLSNSEKCVSCRDKMYVHVQQCSIGWWWQGHGNVLFYDCIGCKAMFREEGELLQHIATCDHTY